MRKDEYGCWKASKDEDADWKQCIAMRDEGNIGEAALMARELLQKIIRRDLASISNFTGVSLHSFEDDYQQELLLIILNKLPQYKPESGPFITMIYKDMLHLISEFKRAPLTGGKGAPSAYQVTKKHVSVSSVESINHSIANGAAEKTYEIELVDEKEDKDIADKLIRQEEEACVNVIRTRFPFTNGDKNTLYNVAAVAKFLGGYASLSDKLKQELSDIWQEEDKVKEEQKVKSLSQEQSIDEMELLME